MQQGGSVEPSAFQLERLGPSVFQLERVGPSVFQLERLGPSAFQLERVGPSAFQLERWRLDRLFVLCGSANVFRASVKSSSDGGCRSPQGGDEPY
ncbi:MAG: hypothetical protein QM784_26055 [Polyangiaceae bacterium]